MKKIIFVFISLYLSFWTINTFAQSKITFWVNKISTTQTETTFWVNKASISNTWTTQNKETIIYWKLKNFDDIKIDKIYKKANEYKIKATNEDKIIIEDIMKQIVKIKTERKIKEEKEFIELLNSIKKEIKTWQSLPTDFSDL